VVQVGRRLQAASGERQWEAGRNERASAATAGLIGDKILKRERRYGSGSGGIVEHTVRRGA